MKIIPLSLVLGTLRIAGRASPRGGPSASSDNSDSDISHPIDTSSPDTSIADASKAAQARATNDAAQAQVNAAQALVNQDNYNANVMPVPPQ